jgi:hypothetical protein
MEVSNHRNIATENLHVATHIPRQLRLYQKKDLVHVHGERERERRAARFSIVFFSVFT